MADWRALQGSIINVMLPRLADVPQGTPLKMALKSGGMGQLCGV